MQEVEVRLSEIKKELGWAWGLPKNKNAVGKQESRSYSRIKSLQQEKNKLKENRLI